MTSRRARGVESRASGQFRSASDEPVRDRYLDMWDTNPTRALGADLMTAVTD